MSASLPGPIFVYSPATSFGGQRDGPNWAALPAGQSPGRPALRPWSAAGRPRRAADVSPRRSPGQPCVSTPSEGLRAPFPPRRAHPHPSPSAPRFPTAQSFSATSCPPTSIEFRWFRPEPALSKSVHCFRPIEGRCTPASATKSPFLPLRRQTQTRVQAPHFMETLRFCGSLEGTPSQEMSHGVRCVSPGDA